MRHRVSAPLIVGVAWATTASAQDGRAELARRELIERAEQARVLNDHVEALALAARAAQLRQTPSLRLLIAQEHLALDHLLSALAEGRACVREAEADSTVRNRERMIGVCRALVEGIEPRIAHVVIRFGGASPEGAHVRVGDDELPSALIGVPIPVLPGAIVVRASAANRAEFEGRVQVQAGAESEVVVTMPESRRTTDLPPRADESPPSLRPSAARARSRGATPFIVSGVGAATLVAGGIVYWQSAEAASERDRFCAMPENCTNSNYQSAVPLDERYRALGLAGAVTLVVGAAALASGLIWIAASGSSSGSSSSRVTALSVTPSTNGVLLGVGGFL